jgi:hypothetical protein
MHHAMKTHGSNRYWWEVSYTQYQFTPWKGPALYQWNNTKLTATRKRFEHRAGKKILYPRTSSAYCNFISKHGMLIMFVKYSSLDHKNSTRSHFIVTCSSSNPPPQRIILQHNLWPHWCSSPILAWDAIMVEIGILHLEPFINSYFLFLIIVGAIWR